MASNQFGPGRPTGRTAKDIADEQAKALAEDARRQAAAAAAGRDRRSIGRTR
jgi:hypothetical protein